MTHSTTTPKFTLKDTQEINVTMIIVAVCGIASVIVCGAYAYYLIINLFMSWMKS